MRYTLLVTGPAYGTQHASSALLFARALLAQGHQLESVFFYREGVLNANQLSAPASDEVGHGARLAAVARRQWRGARISVWQPRCGAA